MNIVPGLVLVAFGVVFVMSARWGVDVANENRMPGTTPASDKDKWAFIAFGAVFIIIGAFLLLRPVFSG